MPSQNSTAARRIDAIVSHIAPASTPMAERPFITCHVLDTITGRPGAGIDVKLKLVAPEHITTAHWTATTNSDGRVPAWTSSADVNEVVKTAKADLKDGDQLIWSLVFNTEAYYGKGKTFWPQVELRFAAEKSEEHYHVPLLLGPWSYTTYRGS